MNQNQDRDIDEILASLDSLLRESESHNDDTHAEPAASDTQPELQDESAADMEQALDQAVENVSDNMDDIMETEEPSEPMTRVVLTEDMLLENPQVSLPLGQHDSDETVSHSDVSQAEVEGESHADWDEQRVNQWVASVSQDISLQINQLLPDMIRDALQKKLAELQDEKHTKIQHNDDE